MSNQKLIEVQSVCPICGPVEDVMVIGGAMFCASCLADSLVSIGTPVIVMEAVEKDATSGDWICPHCGNVWARVGVEACPHCGRQEDDCFRQSNDH